MRVVMGVAEVVPINAREDAVEVAAGVAVGVAEVVGGTVAANAQVVVVEFAPDVPDVQEVAEECVVRDVQEFVQGVKGLAHGSNIKQKAKWTIKAKMKKSYREESSSKMQQKKRCQF